MVKLVKEVKKNLGKEKGKSLDATLASLDKLQKQGNKIKVDDSGPSFWPCNRADL